jgi:hypothetical protein
MIDSQEAFSKLHAAEIEICQQQGITDIYDAQGNLALSKIYHQRTGLAETKLIVQTASLADIIESGQPVFDCPGPQPANAQTERTIDTLFCPTNNTII